MYAFVESESYRTRINSHFKPVSEGDESELENFELPQQAGLESLNWVRIKLKSFWKS